MESLALIALPPFRRTPSLVRPKVDTASVPPLTACLPPLSGRLEKEEDEEDMIVSLLLAIPSVLLILEEEEEEDADDEAVVDDVKTPL